MITPKSLLFPAETNTKNSKQNIIQSNLKELYNNTHEHYIHSSNIVKDISTKVYSQNGNKNTLGDSNNSSFVIKYLGKRSTENFPNRLDNQSSNSSKLKHTVDYNRLENLNTIDRIDIDNKKLNTTKLPTNNVTTKISSSSNEDIERINLVTSEGGSQKYDNISSKSSTQSDFEKNINSHNSKETNESIKVKNNTGSNNLKAVTNVREYTPPAISRKNVTICVILGFCVAVAVGINFINLSSDFDDLMDFYKGFMGRRLLIVEGRLTSRSHILLLKAKEQIRMELGPQVKNNINCHLMRGCTTMNQKLIF